ncbi:hypothetical protein CHARACLAT_000814 [Characodon lateralis]|uniref:Uncharacterized protein n=1 Tax=Characodon lateralis TaxID=208331 RepID=A0ABU7EZS3_9TELE|nr:hypothetical protein [Characodon lateralis]
MLWRGSYVHTKARPGAMEGSSLTAKSHKAFNHRASRAAVLHAAAPFKVETGELRGLRGCREEFLYFLVTYVFWMQRFPAQRALLLGTSSQKKLKVTCQFSP